MKELSSSFSGTPAMMSSQNVVRLNVGGTVYTTTKSTLCRYPSSMLGAMFNGNMSPTTTVEENGCYFIDRDGDLFGHVLNFLRSSRLALPDDFRRLEALAVEADFYQIEALQQAVEDHRRRVADGSRPKPGRMIEVVEVRTGSIATMPTNNSRVKTIVSGRADVISRLPAEVFGVADKLQHIADNSFTEVELAGSNVRLRLAEFLQGQGWRLVDSDMSSSSGYDSKSMISSLIIEQSYRDRWFLEEPTESMQS